MIAKDLLPLAVPEGDLELLEGNPRRGNVEAVARSLAAFGQRKPIVARRNGTVIAGNHTLQAARQLGWKEIAVVWVDDDDTTANAFALADNRTAELGGYDEAALAELISRVQADDPELLAATGWDADDLAELVDQLAANEPPAIGDDDAELEPPSDPVTSLGDVWLLGDHRLICGDCTSRDVVDELFAGSDAAYTFTSPPYGINLEYEEGDSLDALVALIANVIRSIDRVSAPDAYATMNYADVFRSGEPGFTLMSRYYDEPFTELGWCLRGNRVWYKPFGRLSLSYGTSTTMNLREWEYVQTWRRGRGAEKLREHGLTLRGVWKTFGEDATLNDWRDGDVTTSKSVHPAAFPVVLPIAGMRAYTDPGDIVFEPFTGSGSTIIAGVHESRVVYGCELDPAYVDVTLRRYQAVTGVKPVLERSGVEYDFSEA